MSIDKLAWVHIENRKLLATRTRGRDACYIPGGKREPGESDLQALVREIKEELAVDLLHEQITAFGAFEAPAHGAPAGTTVRMTCYQGPYRGTLQPSREIEEVTWLGYADRERGSEVTRIILDQLRERNLIDD